MKIIPDNIKDRFGIKEEDSVKIILLFLYSFSLGLFIAFYFVPANSQFLDNFGHEELPYAYIISGIVGGVSISIYSFIQKKRHSKILFISAIILMFVIVLLSKLALLLVQNSNFTPQHQVELRKYLSFFVFIWAWPFIALVSTMTGGLALRLFNLLQVKKFFGLINLGGVIAATLSYIIISVIVQYLKEQYDLIIIGSIGLITAFFILLFIYKKFPEKNISKNKDKKAERKKTGRLFKNKYILFIFLGALFSAIVIYIADYGFLITIKSNNSIFKNPESVAKFLSIVYAGLKIGELLISVLSGQILTKGGIKIGLISLSIVITSLFILAFISAEIFGVATYIFLAFITANKMLERIIRRGIEDPAFNVLYQTLPEDSKLFIQTRVGVMQQAAIAIAGVFLLLVNFALQTSGSNFKVEYYPLYALPILIVSLIIAYTLFKLYKIRITEILSNKKLFKFEYKEQDIYASDILQKFILSNDSQIAKFSTVVLSETNPRCLEPYASFLLKVDDNIIRKSILSNIDSTYNPKLISVIETEGNKIGFKQRELRKLILHALFKLDYSEINDISLEKINEKTFSTDTKQQITAGKYLFQNQYENDDALILHLLKSKDKAVKLSAIKIAGKRAKRVLWIRLIDLLCEAEYNNLLISILVEIGDPILQELDAYFIKQEDEKILKKVVQIFANIGSYNAQNYLVSHINHYSREIQNDIIYALSFSGFYADNGTINIIRDKIKSTVENILWFMICIRGLTKEKNTLKLIQTLDLERQNSLEQLFIMLSFTQSKEIVDLIKTNIIGENTIFAIELIDNYIEPEIKKIIIPLFEPITLSQKMKRLKAYFHLEHKTFEETLISIITAESSEIDIWSQVKALELIGKLVTKEQLIASELKNKTIEEPVIMTREYANEIIESCSVFDLADAVWYSLLHTADFMYITAAKILYDKEINFEEFNNNLSNKKQKIYKKIILSEDLIPEKIKHLRRSYIFYGIPERALVRLSTIIDHKKIKKNTDITFLNDNEDENIIIVVKGKIMYKVKNNIQVFNKNSLIIRGLNVSQNAISVKTVSNCLILVANRFQFFNLLASNNELVKNLIKTIKF